MAVTRAKKQKILENIETLMKDSKSLAFIATNKITVIEATSMRKDLRDANASVMVAKKTLIKMAYKNVFGTELDKELPGAVSIIFSFEDSMSWMWIASKYAKEWKKEEKIKFVAAHIEWELIWEEKATKLASIPSRETLLAKFLGSAKSPISSLVRFFDATKVELESKWLEKAWDLISANKDDNTKEEEK